MMTKACTKCGRELPLTEFHADKRRKHGVGSECRDCKRQYRQENKDRLLVAQYERRRRKRKQLTPKRKVWNAVYYAVRTGKIERPDRCEVCGELANTQAHHEDYSQPLDVVWVCQWCHVQRDKQRRGVS